MDVGLRAPIASRIWGSIVTVVDTIEPRIAEWHDRAPDSGAAL